MYTIGLPITCSVALHNLHQAMKKMASEHMHIIIYVIEILVSKDYIFYD